MTTIGRIVHYTLTESDAEAINGRRTDAAGRRAQIRDERPGFQVHIGNQVEAGQTFPAIVVRTWTDDLVNLQVFLDGNDTMWRTSVTQKPTPGEPGTWAFPVRQ